MDHSGAVATTRIPPAVPRMTHLRRAELRRVDFDIHGLARVRLVNPAPRDIAAVAWQLGTAPSRDAGEADLVIEYLPLMPAPRGARFIGTGGAGFAEGAFYARGLGTSSAMIVPYDSLGTGSARLVLRRGTGPVHQLTGLLNLTMLAKGVTPLHAAAFVLSGEGIVACGWSKSGKTEALLGFMSLGATAIGDEWIYLAEDGRMYGLASPIRVEARHLDDLPDGGRQMSLRRRYRMRATAPAGLLGTLLGRRGGLATPIARALAGVASWSHSDVPAHALFGEARVAGDGPIDRVFLLMSAAVDEVVVRPLDALEAADRLVFAHQHHRRSLLASYAEFRYAFPDRPSDVLETAEARERDLLNRYLRGKPSYLVEHPHPVEITALAEAMARFCGASHQRRSSRA